MSTLAFLTDFGVRDWYAAAMKGVARSIAPQAALVDISHHVHQGDIAAASFILSQCWLDFPAGTVFVTVVDPGVGSERAAVALKAEGRYFVGPDNGLFGWLGRKVTRCHRITNEDFFRDNVSHTFHGRDIFTPVGAHLASGQASLEQVGPEHGELVTAPWPKPEYEDDRAFGRILYIDHYGNAITNLQQTALEERYALSGTSVSLHPRRIPLLKTFSDAPAGTALAYFGSGGLLEIAVNGGNAAQQLDLRLDQHVELVLN
ncbi:SAM hydrolase/SAM-dependent halogenase family protein [Cerasicoccus fimbriatus]|uniref:SAM hydrolase/SAM-dependent halogenase family protein n=1 Tax=Cerasicoccus fimbriatus TaxID=3014554 RepID=UPI0022B35864|nr:SAM-dependent chlorinase/fluorinase [Cerasicoccus sp. TK19100]